jgi:hypothetical protein
VTNGAVNNSGPFTPWLYRAEGAPVKSTLSFPGGVGGPTGAESPGTRRRDTLRRDTLWWSRRMKVRLDGSRKLSKALRFPTTGPTLTAPVPGGPFSVRIGGAPWPCQKPPWGRLTAFNTTTGEFAWQVPMGVNDGLPEAKQNTGRPARAGVQVAQARAGGVVVLNRYFESRAAWGPNWRPSDYETFHGS